MVLNAGEAANIDLKLTRENPQTGSYEPLENAGSVVIAVYRPDGTLLSESLPGEVENLGDLYPSNIDLLGVYRYVTVPDARGIHRAVAGASGSDGLPVREEISFYVH